MVLKQLSAKNKQKILLSYMWKVAQNWSYTKYETQNYELYVKLCLKIGINLHNLRLDSDLLETKSTKNKKKSIR